MDKGSQMSGILSLHGRKHQTGCDDVHQPVEDGVKCQQKWKPGRVSKYLNRRPELRALLFKGALRWPRGLLEIGRGLGRN